MIGQEFISALRRDLTKQYEEYAEQVLMGTCDSFDEYRRAIGMLQGLRTARGIVDELVRKVNEGAFG